MFIRRVLACPLLAYRFAFKKWANIQEAKFQKWLSFVDAGKKEITFLPELPNNRAALRNAFVYLGYSVTNSTNATSIAQVSWEDKTYKAAFTIEKKAINAHCIDISKSYLDKMHQIVFGYGLTVNPAQSVGKILEKSEINGTHNAIIVQAPCSVKENHVYQKLVNTRKGLFYEDIRPLVIGDKIPLCYLNYRLEGKRFSAKKIKAKLVKPNDVLSALEQQQIIVLCKKMGADIAELDVLRDREDKKIYVVDLNTTAYGPAHGLSFDNKKKAIELYANSLKSFLTDNF